MTRPEDRPPFPSDEASALLGKIVIVGLTFVDEQGKLLGRQQMHGMIVSVDPKLGIEINLRGDKIGEKYRLPPDLRPFREKAPPGEYRLKETGEIILNPDYAVSFTITKHPRDPGGQ